MNLLIFYILYLLIKKFNLTDIEIIIVNFFLLKAWGVKQKTVSSLNGVTWFLSALMLCYFLTPFLLEGIKKINYSLILFTLVAIIRLSVEEFVFRKAENILGSSFHFGAVIRALEFFLGMLTVPLYFKIKSYVDKASHLILIKILFTVIQANFPIYIYYIMMKYNKILHRGHFVLIFCFNIFIIGFDYGYLSNFIETKLFKIIMSCQMEMYMLQISVPNIMLKIMRRKKWKYPPNLEIIFLIKLLVIFIISFIYKSLLKDRLANIMDKIVDFIFKIFN